MFQRTGFTPLNTSRLSRMWFVLVAEISVCTYEYVQRWGGDVGFTSEVFVQMSNDLLSEFTHAG